MLEHLLLFLVQHVPRSAEHVNRGRLQRPRGEQGHKPGVAWCDAAIEEQGGPPSSVCRKEVGSFAEGGQCRDQRATLRVAGEDVARRAFGELLTHEVQGPFEPLLLLQPGVRMDFTIYASRIIISS